MENTYTTYIHSTAIAYCTLPEPGLLLLLAGARPRCCSVGAIGAQLLVEEGLELRIDLSRGPVALGKDGGDGGGGVGTAQTVPVYVPISAVASIATAPHRRGFGGETNMFGQLVGVYEGNLGGGDGVQPGPDHCPAGVEDEGRIDDQRRRQGLGVIEL